MCYSSDCEVILNVKKSILGLTIGHGKFMKHADFLLSSLQEPAVPLH